MPRLRGELWKSNMQYLPEVLRRRRALVTTIWRRWRWSPWKYRIGLLRPHKQETCIQNTWLRTHKCLGIQWQFERRTTAKYVQLRRRSRAKGSMHGSIAWSPLLRYNSISATHLHALYTCCANSYRLSCRFFFVFFSFFFAIYCTAVNYRALLANNQPQAITPRLSFSQKCNP